MPAPVAYPDQQHDNQDNHHQQSQSQSPQQAQIQQPAAFIYYPTHPHVDGTPLHEPQSPDAGGDQEQSGQSTSQSPSATAPLPTELLAAAAAAAFPAASATTTAALPFPPPGTVPVAYFAGPGGSIIAIPQLKTKRRQVKNACTNCQKACKRCDEVRPCTRCVKYGIEKDCTDSQRKERKKGVKRGPYKKREPKTHEEDEAHAQQQAAQLAAAHLLSPESAAALQAMASGAIIYSYGAPPTQQQQSPPTSQMGKGSDAAYSPQYYTAIAPQVQGSSDAPQEGSSSDGATPSASGTQPAQQSQPQAQQTYGIQYYNSLAAYQGYAANAGYIVQPPQGGPGQAPSSPIYQLSGTMGTVHHVDDPIERQAAPLSPASTGGAVKGKGKLVEKPRSSAANDVDSQD